MIVRIAMEGQYELAESDSERINELDQKAIEACHDGDDEQFSAVFREMLDFVRSQGQPVADDHLGGSDLILPPSDSTLEEAKAEITGEGWIPE